MTRHFSYIGKASETGFLGSDVTVVLTKNDNGQMEELQQTHYYPFGGIIADLSSGRDVHNRLYNGKELDTSNNLWWYDYGARQYDPTRGQFTTPDPLAEKYYPWNYYAYCVNNPVRFIDPDGRDKHDWLYKDKRYESLKIAIDHFNDDPKVVNIWAHGNNEGFAKKSWRLNVNTTDAFICELKNTPEFQRTNGKNMTIVLHCCSTAPFAEKLSETDFFKDNNIVIIAPSDNIGVNVTYESQCSTLAEIWYILTGQEVPTETVVTSIVQNNGSWVRYENGKEVKRYASDAEPGSKDFVY